MNWIESAFGKSFKVGKPYVSIEGYGLASAINEIVLLDFEGYTMFVNVVETITCVAVAASNYRVATFSHLTDRVDPDGYACQLEKAWKSERPKLALVGGDDLYDPTDFSGRLEHALTRHGFGIAGKVVGGVGLERRVSMTQNQVLVSEKGHRVSERELRISF